jgi:hypothetical protein
MYRVGGGGINCSYNQAWGTIGNIRATGIDISNNSTGFLTLEQATDNWSTDLTDAPGVDSYVVFPGIVFATPRRPDGASGAQWKAHSVSINNNTVSHFSGVWEYIDTASRDTLDINYSNSGAVDIDYVKLTANTSGICVKASFSGMQISNNTVTNYMRGVSVLVASFGEAAASLSNSSALNISGNTISADFAYTLGAAYDNTFIGGGGIFVSGYDNSGTDVEAIEAVSVTSNNIRHYCIGYTDGIDLRSDGEVWGSVGGGINCVDTLNTMVHGNHVITLNKTYAETNFPALPGTETFAFCGIFVGGAPGVAGGESSGGSVSFNFLYCPNVIGTWDDDRDGFAIGIHGAFMTMYQNCIRGADDVKPVQSHKLLGNVGIGSFVANVPINRLGPVVGNPQPDSVPLHVYSDQTTGVAIGDDVGTGIDGVLPLNTYFT